MKFTDRINRIEESLTIGMSKKARSLKAQGKDVISLSLGEPDFDTPEHIKNAAIAAIKQGKTKYPPVGGIPELKQAIVEKYKKTQNVDYTVDEVMVSSGAKQCIMNAILSLVNHGDEVIIPLPYWVSYSEMVAFAGGKCVFVPSNFSEGFSIDLAYLKSVITEKSKVLIFSSPSNPAGSVLSKYQLDAIAEIVAQNPQLTVISDEIYEHILFENAHLSMAEYSHIKDQVIIINGVSKGFAMTGWRIGYMVANKEIIKACDKLQGQFTSGANVIAQWASVEAISADLKPTTDMVKVFAKRRDLMVNLLREIQGLETDVPKGAFYLFPKVSSFYGKKIGGTIVNNSLEFCDAVLEHALVSLVPGVAFGMDDHVRISYASSEEELKEALRRLKVLLNP